MSSLRRGLRPWFPALSLACAAFLYFTSEFLPVGLLPGIAASLGVTAGTAGLLITIYAWVVAVMSLPLTMLFNHCQRRKLMPALLLIFCLANLIGALSTTFIQLAAARIGIALTHALFWAMLPAFISTLAPEGKKALGLSLIVYGTSASAVCGIPFSTLLGQRFAWQLPFLCLAVAGLGLALGMQRILPTTKQPESGSFKAVRTLLRSPNLRYLYFLATLIVSGHFCLYTYIVPFMETTVIAKNSPALLLLIFGASGIIGGIIGGRHAEAHPKACLRLALLTLCGVFLLMAPLNAMPALGFLLVAIWGAAFSLLAIVLQIMVLEAASEHADIAIAIYSALFNVGIGLGSLLGALSMACWGYAHLGYASACIIAMSLIMAAKLRK